ncbi:GNAT family N-acetyltransferase [bacterium]|nr:GNAT family N-acetyltransferase [bacterium]
MEKFELNYICKFTSELSEKEINDFVKDPFSDKPTSADFDIEWFNWQYKENIFGDSIHVIVYSNDEVVGKQAFWRNDLEPGFEAYQQINLFVSPNMRRKGIFTEMTKRALKLAHGSYSYNFPDRSQNSAPGFLKFGWEMKKDGEYFDLYIGLKRNLFESLKAAPPIPDEYLIWRFINSPVHEYCYTELNGRYLLLRIKRLVFNIKIYIVMGRIGTNYINELKKVNPVIFLTYNSGKKLWRIRKHRVIVIENTTYKTYNGPIPLWRAD